MEVNDAQLNYTKLNDLSLLIDRCRSLLNEDADALPAVTHEVLDRLSNWHLVLCNVIAEAEDNERR